MGMLANMRGPKGDTGAAGAQGDKGDTGDAGAQGEQGIQGEQGEAGSCAYTSSGDLASADYVKTDFTMDGTWRDLDLSGKVAAGATLVLIRCDIKHGTPGRYIMFRKKGYNNAINAVMFRAVTADSTESYDAWLEVDGDRVCQYNGPANAFVDLTITVKGSLAS